jgi:hypothetical protein
MTLTQKDKIGAGVLVFLVVILPIIFFGLPGAIFKGDLGKGTAVFFATLWGMCFIFLGNLSWVEVLEPKTDKIQRLIKKMNDIKGRSRFMCFDADHKLENAFKMHLAKKIKPIQDELNLLMPSYHAPAADVIGAY